MKNRKISQMMPWYLGLFVFIFICLIVMNIFAMYIYGTFNITTFPSEAKVVMTTISFITGAIITGITFGNDL